MLFHRIRGLNRAYYCTLALVVSGVYWLYLFFLASLLSGYTFERYVTYNLAAILALGIRALNSGEKAPQLLRSDFQSNHRAAFYDMSFAGGAILLILVATKDVIISRLFLFTFLPLLYLVLFFSRRFLPKLLIKGFFTKGHQQKALLVGSREQAERMEKWSAQMLNLGLDATSFYHGLGSNGDSNVLSSSGLTTLERIVRRERITQVVLLDLPEKRESLSGIAAVCDRLGSRLLMVDNLPAIFNRSVSHFSLSGLNLITVMEEPLEDPVNRLLKRSFDLLISSMVVLFILPPLAFMVAIIQRKQSPGPLFFRQTRSGRANKPFRIFKFRTMHPTNQSPSRQASKNDERVYALGRWLRRTSLDEFPQFINVLRGEMSVVGPRPHMIVHNRRFAEVMASYRIRAFVKPGITGLAQVSGFRGEARTNTEILKRVKLDIAYVESWSLWQDFGIVLKTARQVILPGETAY